MEAGQVTALAEGMGGGAGGGSLRQGLKQHRGLSLQRYEVVMVHR